MRSSNAPGWTNARPLGRALRKNTPLIPRDKASRGGWGGGSLVIGRTKLLLGEIRMNNDLCFVELFGSIAPIARHTGKQKDSSFCIASFVPLQSSLPTYTLFEMHLHPIAALHRTSPYLGRPQKREYFSISRSSVLEVQEKFWQTIEKFKHGAYKNILAILNIEKTLGTSLAE